MPIGFGMVSLMVRHHLGPSPLQTTAWLPVDVSPTLVLEPHHVDPKCLLTPVADRLRKRHLVDRDAEHRA
jgi:hypothetical protein